MLTLLLALAVAISLAGCSKAASTSAPVDKTPAPEVNVVADAANAYFANLSDDSNKISQADFVEKVKAGEDMFVMDIRQADVYGEGHIKGAVNLPWGTDISDNLAKLPTDKPIYVYCYTGQTAGQTVALLNVAGFNAKSVNLGWDRGLSKVEGIADVTVKEATTIDDAVNTEVAPEIKAAIDEYFAKLAEVKGTTYANYKISEDDAKALLDAKDDSVMFLSVRKAADYAEGHIEGAINIPYGNGMQASFEQLPMDKKIIVYCYTGQTAGQTVAILKLLGYDAVSLNSGMGMETTGETGWANKGFPVVK